MHTQIASFADTEFDFELSGAFIRMFYSDIALNRCIQTIAKTPTTILIFRFQRGAIGKGDDLIHRYIIVVGIEAGAEIIRTARHHD